jgi:hypothetical protein
VRRFRSLCLELILTRCSILLQAAEAERRRLAQEAQASAQAAAAAELRDARAGLMERIDKLQLAFTAALRQREAAGLRACVPLRQAVLVAERAIDAACEECIVAAPAGSVRPVVALSDAAVAAVSLAEQRVQACVVTLGQAVTSQSRARATLASIAAAAKRAAGQVCELI